MSSTSSTEYPESVSCSMTSGNAAFHKSSREIVVLGVMSTQKLITVGRLPVTPQDGQRVSAGWFAEVSTPTGAPTADSGAACITPRLQLDDPPGQPIWLQPGRSRRRLAAALNTRQRLATRAHQSDDAGGTRHSPKLARQSRRPRHSHHPQTNRPRHRTAIAGNHPPQCPA